MNKLVTVGLLLIALGALPASVLAEAPPAGDKAAEAVSAVEAPESEGIAWPRAGAIIGACFGAGLCTIGGGFAIAHIGGKCIEGIARQPEASGAMFAPMVVSAAMVEGGMLFAIVVCLMGVLG